MAFLTRDKALIKQSLDFFTDRKIDLDKCKLESKELSTGLIKEKYQLGAVRIFLLNSDYINEIKLMANPELNSCFKYFNQIEIQSILSEEHIAFMNEENMYTKNISEHVLQHELQHFFDSCLFIEGKSWEKEYRAYLAACAFSESSNKPFQMMINLPQGLIKEYGYETLKNEFISLDEDISDNLKASLKIIFDLNEMNLQLETMTDFEIKSNTRLLLDKNYIKNCNMNYEEILKYLKEIQKNQGQRYV